MATRILEGDRPVLLTPTETAALLRISTRTLRDLKRRGEIAFVPLGRGSVGYRREAVEACAIALEQRKPTRTPKPVPIAGRQPAWLAEAIAEGRTNVLTGRRYGEVFR